MKNLIDNYRNNRSGWVSSVRSKFDCDTDESHLKIWELWVLILCSYSKELLNIIIYTVYPSKGSLTELFSSTYPLNIELFWLLFLKLGVGYIFLLYLNIKHKGTNTIWRICAFWALTIFNPLMGSLESKYDVISGVSSVLRLVILSLFFIYFFFLDPVHIDSLKLLIYDDLMVDENSGRVYKTPSSKISWKKLKQLGLSTVLLIASTLSLILIVTQFIELFRKRESSAGGGGGAAPSPVKPKNQQQIENLAKTNLLTVIISSIIIAPIVEEWVYRRFIMKEGQFKWWTILLSGFMFGLIHLREREGFLELIPYVLPGLVYATGMYISKNIWHSIAAHTMHNTIVLIRMLLLPSA